MSQSENIDLLAAALCKAQSIMAAATLNKINPHFKSKYADLASVIDAIRKPLTDNGLSFTQTTEYGPEQFFLSTTLLHTSGQWLRSEYPLPSNVTPQAMGSALTYARRYSLSAITGTSGDEDDDGEKAEIKPSVSEKRLPMPSKPTEADWETFCKAYVAGIQRVETKAEADAWRYANQDLLDRVIDKKFAFPDITQKLETALEKIRAKYAQT